MIRKTGFPKSVGHVGHVWRFLKMSDEELLGRHTLRTNSSLHCISSSKPAIQLYRDSSTVTELKIYSGLGYLFWECRHNVQWQNMQKTIKIRVKPSFLESRISLIFKLILGQMRKGPNTTFMWFLSNIYVWFCNWKWDCIKWPAKSWNVRRRTPASSVKMSNELQKVFVKPAEIHQTSFEISSLDSTLIVPNIKDTVRLYLRTLTQLGSAQKRFHV